MAWKIDRDYLAEPGERNDVGTGQWPKTGEPPMPYRFRLLDDDGEIYYGGRYCQTAMDNDTAWGGLYNALKWAEGNAGCTDLQVSVADYTRGMPAEAAESVATSDGWVSVYA